MNLRCGSMYVIVPLCTCATPSLRSDSMITSVVAEVHWREFIVMFLVLFECAILFHGIQSSLHS